MLPFAPHAAEQPRFALPTQIDELQKKLEEETKCVPAALHIARLLRRTASPALRATAPRLACVIDGADIHSHRCLGALLAFTLRKRMEVEAMLAEVQKGKRVAM